MKNSSQASKKNMWQKLYLTYDFIIDAGLYPWIEEFTLQAIITNCPHYNFRRYWNAHNTYGRYIRKTCSVLTNRFGCYTGWEWKPSKMASTYTPKFSQSCWKATSNVEALWRVAWDSPRNKSSNNTSIHLRLCTWPWAIYQSLEKWDNNLGDRHTILIGIRQTCPCLVSIWRRRVEAICLKTDRETHKPCHQWHTLRKKGK